MGIYESTPEEKEARRRKVKEIYDRYYENEKTDASTIAKSKKKRKKKSKENNAPLD